MQDIITKYEMPSWRGGIAGQVVSGSFMFLHSLRDWSINAFDCHFDNLFQMEFRISWRLIALPLQLFFNAVNMIRSVILAHVRIHQHRNVLCV